MKTVFFISLLVFNSAVALMLPISDTELVNSADTIVKATVVSTQYEWNSARTVIFTFVDIRIDHVYKGNIQPGSTVTLAIPGGYDPESDMRLTISNQPQFTLREQAVFYLSAAQGTADGINYQLFEDHPNFEGLMRINSFSQGKHNIQETENSQRARIFKSNTNTIMELTRYETQLRATVKALEKEDNR